MHDSVAAPTRLLTEVSRPIVGTTVAGPERRPLVMVLGMHRSGTSLCSHVLSALGVDMADQVGPNGVPERDNLRGHWERWEIVDLHNRILELLNRGYYDPVHDLAFPTAWWADPKVAAVRRDIVAFLKERMREAYFGFKDPRTVRFLPLWHQIADELKLAPKFVFCLRNPAQVARSLLERDAVDPETAEARWFAYVIDFFRYSRGVDFCLVEYEAWFDDAATNVRKLCKFLDLDWQHFAVAPDLAVSGLVDRQLRHDSSPHQEAKQPLVRSLYQLARRAEHDLVARDQIQTFVAQFVGFQQLHGGLQRRFEQIAAAAARLPAIEQETAALREDLAARDVSLERSAARATEAEAARQAAEEKAGELKAALATHEEEATEWRGALVNAKKERREREAVLAASVAQAEELREALVDAEKQRREREAVLAGSVAQAEELREVLATTEKQQQESVATVAALQLEITGLRTALEDAEHPMRQRDEDLVGLRNNIAELQDRLVETQRQAAVRTELERELAAANRTIQYLKEAAARHEHRAQQQRNASEEMQRQIVHLRGELGAAREVGTALMDALRAVPQAPSAIDKPEKSTLRKLRWFSWKWTRSR
jgi:hypothetical protein